MNVRSSFFVIASKVFIALLLLSLYKSYVCAQELNERKVTSPSAAAYLEGGGSGLGWLTIHGEVCFFRFKHQPVHEDFAHSLRLSVGVTTAPTDRYYLPVSLKFLMFESDHHIEVGTGFSILLKEVMIEDGFKHSFPASLVVMTFALGYRFESQNGGFQFRFIYTPVYEFTTEALYPFIGVSVGFAL